MSRLAQRGRHRRGRAGTAYRPELVARRPGSAPHRRRGHRRRVTAESVSMMAATMVMIAIAVSGWFAASGASAVAQMLAR